MLARLKEHPLGFWFVFWGELAERASYYGMRTLLTLFLINVFHYADARAGTIQQFFGAFCYILPLLGGFIADRYIGKYRTIVYFSIPYILGHIILGHELTNWGLYTALALLAGGSGAIKPNTSTLMGLIYERAGKKHLLTEAFSYYYAAINIGAAITSLSLPKVRDYFQATSGSVVHGYTVALMFPTILMAVALLVFALGKRWYPIEEIVRTEKTPEQRAEEAATLWRISGIFALIALFWFVYDQSSSSWVIFTNRNADLWLRPFNIHLTADQLQGLNPVLIVAFTPLFNWMWQVVRRRRGSELPATQKMMIGFFLVIGCMAVMAVAGYLSRTGPVSVWWVVLATTVITLSELCVSVVGLEFAFTQASEQTHSTVTAAFLMTVFVGDSIGGFFIDRFYEPWGPGPFFLAQTFIMVAVAIAFHFVARHFEKQDVVDDGHLASSLHPA